MRRLLVVLLALAFMLAACGRVGPLVRSRPKPVPAVQPAAAATPAAQAVQPAAAVTPAAQDEQTDEEKKR